MTLPPIATHDEWLAARTDLLAKEKELTRARDALSAERRRLPMERVEEDYRLTGPEGEVGLLDLFDGRDQLIVYHFMFDPSWDDGCPSCSAGIDELSPGFLAHLAARDTSFAMVSRAPLPKLQRWKERKGWDHLRWYSSHGSTFNVDFGVTLDPSQGEPVYNYRTASEAGMEMTPDDDPQEAPGRSCFLQVDGEVFHTYSQYARGLESTGGSYYFLDLTALGRQEEWEEPAGRAGSARAARPDFAE